MVKAPGAEAADKSATTPVLDAIEPAPASFEVALSELETIVSQMESGTLSLEASLEAYRRGAQLLQFCQFALRDAQQQVKVLEAGMLRDFTGAEERD